MERSIATEQKLETPIAQIAPKQVEESSQETSMTSNSIVNSPLNMSTKDVDVSTSRPLQKEGTGLLGTAGFIAKKSSGAPPVGAASLKADLEPYTHFATEGSSSESCCIKEGTAAESSHDDQDVEEISLDDDNVKSVVERGPEAVQKRKLALQQSELSEGDKTQLADPIVGEKSDCVAGERDLPEQTSVSEQSIDSEQVEEKPQLTATVVPEKASVSEQCIAPEQVEQIDTTVVPEQVSVREQSIDSAGQVGEKPKLDATIVPEQRIASEEAEGKSKLDATIVAEQVCLGQRSIGSEQAEQKQRLDTIIVPEVKELPKEGNNGDSNVTTSSGLSAENLDKFRPVEISKNIEEADLPEPDAKLLHRAVTDYAEDVESLWWRRVEWQHSSFKRKLHMIETMLDRCKAFGDLFRAAAIEKRGYVTTPAEKNLKAFENEAEKTFLTHVSDGMLIWWLSELRAVFCELVSTGKFPSWYTVSDEKDGVVKCSLKHSSRISAVLLAGTSLELFTERRTPVPEPPTFKKKRSKVAGILHAVKKKTGTPSAAGADSSLEVEGGLSTVPDDDSSKEISVSDACYAALTGTNPWALKESWFPREETIPTTRDGLQYDAECYHNTVGSKVVFVLGAGNFDCPTDVLTALFIENNVVLYKLSPLSGNLKEPLEKIFAPLIEGGFLRIVEDCGPSKTNECLRHPKVDRWYMTGGSHTASSILFGTPQGAVPSSHLTPDFLRIKKPFVAELGNVTPYIIVPGEWAAAEIALHARHLALHIVFNGGHICCHPQVIVTCRNWAQRQDFMDAVSEALQDNSCFPHFYPGSVDKFAQIKARVRDAGYDLDAAMPAETTLLVQNVDENMFLLKEETFCRAACECPVDTAPDMAAFLSKAIDLANNKMSGSLAVTIISKESGPQLDAAIAALRYTAVSVNCHVAMSFFMPQGIWGGYCKRQADEASHLGSGLGGHLQEMPSTLDEINWNRLASNRVADLLRQKNRGWTGGILQLAKAGAALTLGV